MFSLLSSGSRRLRGESARLCQDGAGSGCALRQPVSGANKGEQTCARQSQRPPLRRRSPSFQFRLCWRPHRPSDPNDVEAVDNPLDENDDDSGFDDWGLLGLLGLVGLAGLAGRKRQDVVRTYDDRTTTR